MKMYNILISNCLDDRLRVVNVLSYENLTQFNHDIIKHYVDMKLCEWSQEKIHHIESSKVYDFSMTEDDFRDIDKILTLINR